jgi:hypothetical protein
VEQVTLGHIVATAALSLRVIQAAQAVGAYIAAAAQPVPVAPRDASFLGQVNNRIVIAEEVHANTLQVERIGTKKLQFEGVQGEQEQDVTSRRYNNNLLNSIPKKSTTNNAIYIATAVAIFSVTRHTPRLIVQVALFHAFVIISSQSLRSRWRGRRVANQVTIPLLLTMLPAALFGNSSVFCVCFSISLEYQHITCVLTRPLPRFSKLLKYGIHLPIAHSLQQVQ